MKLENAELKHIEKSWLYQRLHLIAILVLVLPNQMHLLIMIPFHGTFR